MHTAPSNDNYFGEPCLTFRQVADYLGISPRQVYRLIHSGDLPPPIKVGKLPRILQSELKASIEKLKFKRRPPSQV